MSPADDSQTPSDGTSHSSKVGRSDQHKNGHLVYTGFYARGHAYRLFIHTSRATTGPHNCHVYSCNDEGNQIAGGVDEEKANSATHTVKEHGWFLDIDIFQRICKNHPVPNGPNPQARFISWRDGLLASLDANNSGGLWTRID